MVESLHKEESLLGRFSEIHVRLLCKVLKLLSPSSISFDSAVVSISAGQQIYILDVSDPHRWPQCSQVSLLCMAGMVFTVENLSGPVSLTRGQPSTPDTHLVSYHYPAAVQAGTARL